MTFSAYVEPTWVTGRTDRLMRAVGNLLDNASAVADTVVVMAGSASGGAAITDTVRMIIVS